MNGLKKGLSRSTFLAILIASIFSVPARSATESSSGPGPNLTLNPDWPSPVADEETHGLFLVDLLEYSPSSDSGGSVDWDLLGWRGGDYNRFWFKSEGSQSGALSQGGEGDLRVLYGRMIWPFFDLQAGIRHARNWGNEKASRFFGVLSLQGLVPYSFEIEPELFISEKGALSVHLTAEQDFLMTQRAILQFRMETSAALQSDEEFGSGRGLNDLSLGVRMRYEFWREFAPYVGVSWNSLFGETETLARRSGEQSGPFAAIIGLRVWY